LLTTVFPADPAKPKALELLYTLLVTVARIVSAAILSRGAHNTLQGLRFLRDYRTLVSHTLKRSAGIGPVGAPGQGPLDDKIADLADAFMILIVATGFLEVGCIT
jgi:nuclear pore complex protein Nup205